MIPYQLAQAKMVLIWPGKRCSPSAFAVIMWLVALVGLSTVAGWQTVRQPKLQVPASLKSPARVEKKVEWPGKCEYSGPMMSSHNAFNNADCANTDSMVRRKALGLLASGLLSNIVLYPGVADSFYACNGGGNPTLPPCPSFNISRPDSLQSIQQIRGSYNGELAGLKNISRALKR
jgi:hypothetical protein